MMAIGTFSTMIVASASAVAAIPAAERQVLLDIYAQTNGANWTPLTAPWTGVAGTECSWTGVTCDVTQSSVTGISLARQKLTGSLPNSLNQLTSLNTFNASGNRITGPIPSLTGLVNLQYLDLSRNEFSGSIPSLTGLNSLTEFKVRTNRLSGILPSLAGLDNLAVIDVAHNLLSGTIPDVPSPNNLVAEGSALCPNQFVVSPDAAWDAATAGYGHLPWSTDCTYAYGVVPVPVANGTIYPSTRQLAGYFDSIIDFDIVPAPGYGAAVRGTCEQGYWNGTSYRLIVNEYEFSAGPLPPGPDCTVEPVFSNARFNVTVTSTGNGATTQVGVNNVLFGTHFTVNAVAAPDHHAMIASDCHPLPIMHRALSAVTRTEQITRDCSFNVQYLRVFTVTPLQTPGGVIYPYDAVSVLDGRTATFSVSPFSGYRIGGVTGCGVTMNGHRYVTAPITADCTITASFVSLADASAQPVPVGGWYTTLTLLLLVTTSTARFVARRGHTSRRKAQTKSPT